MSNEERELASSLGERLSAERAKLSRLLADLPSVDSGSDERDQLEEEISAVEEKIGLMTDLLRPVRHGAASKIDGLTSLSRRKISSSAVASFPAIFATSSHLVLGWEFSSTYHYTIRR